MSRGFPCCFGRLVLFIFLRSVKRYLVSKEKYGSLFLYFCNKGVVYGAFCFLYSVFFYWMGNLGAVT
jgi:hypothetical protein